MTNMKQALLTVTDVKKFIHEAICNQQVDENLTRLQVMEKYNMVQSTYDRLLGLGMPWYGRPTRKKFRQSELEKWFVENDLGYLIVNKKLN